MNVKLKQKLFNDSLSVDYYRDLLLKKLYSNFEFKNTPDNWDINYLREHLFIDGYVCITDTDIGVIPLQCGITGINVFNHPTTAIIANPVLGSFQRTLDDNAVLVHIDGSYHGVSGIIYHYAYLLWQCDDAIATGLINSKPFGMAYAKTKAEAATIKAEYKRGVETGEPITVLSDTLTEKGTIQYNTTHADVTILDIKERIMSEFLTEIGINNTPREKAERLISAEVDSNNDAQDKNAHYWIDNINDGLEKANRMFGLNVKCVHKESEAEKEQDNGDTTGSGTRDSAE